MNLLKRLFRTRKPMAVFTKSGLAKRKEPGQKPKAIDHMIAVNWPFFL